MFRDIRFYDDYTTAVASPWWISPSVVNIYSIKTVGKILWPFIENPFFRQFFGRGAQQNVPSDPRNRALGAGAKRSEEVKENRELLRVWSDGRSQYLVVEARPTKRLWNT